MSEKEVYIRVEQLFEEIQSEQAKAWARKAGEPGSWSRRRKMPLHDILTCTLAKKGLSAAIEIRQYFQVAGKMEKAVSKQDYLKQRQKLNPDIFRILNRNYLRRFYDGSEAGEWRGHLVMAVDGSRAEVSNGGGKTGVRTAKA